MTTDFISRRAACAALLMFLTALRAPAEASRDPLTLDEALRIFRSSGFDLLIADAAVAAARADEQIAGAVPNPSLALARGTSSTYDRSLCAGCSNRSVSAGLTDLAISDIASGRRRLRQAVARAALGISTRSRADVERTLEFTMKQQLLQSELAKRALDNARQAQLLAAGTLDLAQKRYKAGAVSEADVARADVQKLEADQAVDNGQQTLAQSKAQLAFLLGMPTALPDDVDVADELTRVAISTRLARASPQELQREALQHRPDLGAAQLQVTRARSSVELAHRLRLPDFSPSLQFAQEGRGQSAIQPPTVTLGVSAGLPLFYRYRGEIAKAEADLHAQEIARRKLEAQVTADVTASFAAFESAKQRATRMEEHLLPQAARARDLVRLQYEKGAASLFEFLDAQRTYLAAQNEYLQTLSDYWTAVFQLELATGMELHK